MGACVNLRRTRHGFTLVELLMVIVIISILAGLISAAAIVARSTAKRAVVKTEITQLDMALQNYKTEYGEFPPDFANVNLDNDPTTILPLEGKAQNRVIRHLRKRFPRYTPNGDRLGNRAGDSRLNVTAFQRFANDVYDGTNGTVDPLKFDAATALAFWLGGLPEDISASELKLNGFHTDPKFPFKQGAPRSQPFYDFDVQRLEKVNGNLRFYPTGVAEAPYVYFKAVRLASGNYEYGDIDTANTPNLFEQLFYDYTLSGKAANVCVPYLKRAGGDPSDSSVERVWESARTYQILTAGLDSQFSDEDPTLAGPSRFRFSTTGDGMGDGDQDNLTSFADGKLEDQIE